MTDFPALFGALAGVEYIVVGGAAAAATAHGSARLTLDLDVVYRRTPDNIARVAASVARHHPHLREPHPACRFDGMWRPSHGLNFTLVTDLGAIDFLGEIASGGTYDALLPNTHTLTLFGH